ncbi:MAG: hypothetical protein AAF433_17850 [Bacteroidota bacterium]
MYKQLDQYLVANLPRVWRSRILFFTLFAIVTTIVFSQLKGSEFIRQDGDGALIFIPVLAAFYWVYTQIRHPPFLRRFSVLEILLTSILNTICLGMLLLPFLVLHDEFYFTYDNSTYTHVHAVYAVLPFISLMVFLPCAFLSFVIRDYSASEVLILIITFLAFGGLLIFITSIFDFDDAFLPIYLLLYLIALVKVVVALVRRQYGKWDKRIIFLLTIGAPWMVAVVYAIFFGDGSSRDLIPAVEFVEEPYVYFYCGLGVYLFLLFFIWYVTRSFEKPMRVK